MSELPEVTERCQSWCWRLRLELWSCLPSDGHSGAALTLPRLFLEQLSGMEKMRAASV